MRIHGIVESAAGLGLHGHACWAYEDDGDFRAAAVAFLEDGVRLGQTLAYIGRGRLDDLRVDLAGLDAVDDLIAQGRLRILSFRDTHDATGGTDAERALATYDGETRRALDSGMTGLRVVAEVTDLVRDAGAWDAHLRWEAIADRYMSRMPMAALCAYDRRELDERIVRHVACLHPAANAPEVAPFRLYSCPGGLALEGELDCFGVDTLERALALVPGGTVLNLGGVRFMDHRSAEVLADRTRVRGLTVSQAPPSVRRVCGLLGVQL